MRGSAAGASSSATPVPKEIQNRIELDKRIRGFEKLQMEARAQAKKNKEDQQQHLDMLNQRVRHLEAVVERAGLVASTGAHEAAAAPAAAAEAPTEQQVCTQRKFS